MGSFFFTDIKASGYLTASVVISGHIESTVYNLSHMPVRGGYKDHVNLESAAGSDAKKAGPVAADREHGQIIRAVWYKG